MEPEPNPTNEDNNTDYDDDDDDDNDESDTSSDDNDDDDDDNDEDDDSSTNDDEENENKSSIPVFLCPRCPGLFFSQHRRNVHFINEMLTMCMEEVVNILKARGIVMSKPRVGRRRYVSCSIEHLRSRKRPRYRPRVGRTYRRLDSDSLFKILAHARPSPFPTQIPGFFPNDFDPLPVVLNGHDVTLPSQPLPPSTLTPITRPNGVNQCQSVAPMPYPDIVATSRFDTTGVGRLATRQEGQTPPPRQQSGLGCNNGNDNEIKEEDPEPKV